MEMLRFCIVFSSFCMAFLNFSVFFLNIVGTDFSILGTLGRGNRGFEFWDVVW